MKYLQLTILGILGFVITSSAQQKVIEKAIIKTPTVQCEQCKDRIEKFLAHQYGIASVKVDYKKKTTLVTWLTDRTNIEIIKTAIANAGYDADDVSADEDAYKKLPKCCKKPNEKIIPPAKN
ncbi:MAG: heavy-metal-associated domain-containing protein [Ferruginibacter sp.]